MTEVEEHEEGGRRQSEQEPQNSKSRQWRPSHRDPGEPEQTRGEGNGGDRSPLPEARDGFHRMKDRLAARRHEQHEVAPHDVQIDENELPMNPRVGRILDRDQHGQPQSAENPAIAVNSVSATLVSR